MVLSGVELIPVLELTLPSVLELEKVLELCEIPELVKLLSRTLQVPELVLELADELLLTLLTSLLKSLPRVGNLIRKAQTKTRVQKRHREQQQNNNTTTKTLEKEIVKKQTKICNYMVKICEDIASIENRRLKRQSCKHLPPPKKKQKKRRKCQQKDKGMQ